MCFSHPLMLVVKTFVGNLIVSNAPYTFNAFFPQIVQCQCSHQIMNSVDVRLPSTILLVTPPNSSR